MILRKELFGYKVSVFLLYLLLFCNPKESIGFNADSIADLIFDAKKELAAEKSAVTQWNHCTDISFYYRNLYQYDSAKIYANRALTMVLNLNDSSAIAGCYNEMGLVLQGLNDYGLAVDYYHKALAIRRILADDMPTIDALNQVGFALYHQQKYGEAIPFFQESAQLAENINSLEDAGRAYNNSGIMNDILGDPAKALQEYMKALGVYEQLKSDELISGTLMNIALVLVNRKSYKEAGNYYRRAYNIVVRYEMHQGINSAGNGLGMVYDKLGQYDTAYYYYNKALDAAKFSKHDYGMAMSLGNLALNSEYQGDYSAAIAYYEQSIAIKERLGNKASLAIGYIGLGQVQSRNGQRTEGLKNLKRGLVLAKAVDYVEYIKQGHEILHSLYADMGHKDLGYDHLLALSVIKDSLLSESNTKIIEELTTKYQTEKLEQEKQLMAQEAQISEAKIKAGEELNKRNTYLLIGLAAIGALLAGIAVVMTRSSRNRKVANKELQLKNEEILLQKGIIEEKNKDITDSIRYAENIQRALLPTIENLKDSLPDGFILFQPKDIVSGDFYWLQQHNDKIYFAACDCTGHGVPGAFMSMIGSSLLDEAVVEKGITQPNEIFYEVRKGFINALKQTEATEQKDGMDAVLCSWNKKGTLEYAMAYSPLLLIRKGEILETKADKQPVGYHSEEQKPFTHHELKLEKGDTVYLFSDGYPDQFGGKRNKKFMMKNFKKLLLSMQDKTMNEQKAILEETLVAWKGDTEQVDDILVMGVRF